MTKIIAEVGCNHMGSFDTAIEMIYIAKKYCNVDIIKFQKRTVRELLSKEEYNAPHPVMENSYGKTYGEHRDFLELSIEQHIELKEYCDSLSVEYSCSVWDLNSAKDIISLNPRIIKIPSPCNLNFDMLDYLTKKFNGEIHISLGMTTRREERNIMNIIQNNGRLKDIVLYACTSSYPSLFEDVCLMEIKRLKDHWGALVKSIGFSGHHLGIAVDMGAITLGASHVERHFTLDRTSKGTDHAASLEPDGLRKLVRDSAAISSSLKYKKSEVLNCEIAQRKKFNKGI
tara:strand:- start:441 stop:1298 length:858 start_codon:yes stop_codon:yes gene_type:complete